MKDIDFNFFSDEDNENIIFKEAKTISEKLVQAKELALIEAIEIIEGKVPSRQEIRNYGGIHKISDTEEVVYWRTKPILRFKWSIKLGKLELEIQKFYV